MSFKNKDLPVIDGIPNENNRLLTLCFASLAVTCTEAKTVETNYDEGNVDNSTIIRGFEIDEEEGFDYIHIPHIPCNIARIFWNELLDVKVFHSNKYDEGDKENRNDDHEQQEHLDMRLKTPKRKNYWNKFITEDERKTFLQIVESQTSPYLAALEKIKKQLSASEDIDTEDIDDASFDTSYLSHFFRNELKTIGTTPSFDNNLLVKDEYFQYLRDTLLKSQVVELVVKEKEIVGFIKNQESYEKLSNLNYFLDDFAIASLKQFFNPKTALEYFKPVIYTGGANDGESSLGSSEVVVKVAAANKRSRSTISSPTYSSASNRSFFNSRNSIISTRIRCSRRSLAPPNMSSVTSNHCCVRLMQVSKLEGGLGVIRKKSKRRLSPKKSEESCSTTFEIWNHVMAEACLKLYNPYYSPSFLRDSIVSLDSQKFDSEEDRKYQLKQRTSNKDDTLSYALKMLPSHLMRARRISDAIDLLNSYDFIFSRLCILGAEKAARQLRQDCEELRLRLSHIEDFYDDENITDPKQVIVKLFYSFKDYYEKTSNLMKEDRSNEGSIFHGIGWSIERMGWKADSLTFYKKALECKKDGHDYSLSSIIQTLSSISNVLLASGEYKEGMKHLTEKQSLQKQIVGDNDLAIAKTLKSIGMINSVLGNNQAAILSYEEALRMEKNKVGDNGPQLQDTFNSLGRVYFVVQDYVKAVQCYEETLRIAKLNQDENHLRVARAHHNLGRALFKIQDFNGALTHLSQALTWRNLHLPENHEDIAKTLHAMGSVYMLMDYDASNISNAVSCFEDALQITKHNLGPDHEEVGRRLYDLAVAYGKRGKFEKAVESKVEIVRILKIKNGEKHELVADAIRNLGLLCKDQGDYQQAIDCFQEVLEITKFHNEKDDQNAITKSENFTQESTTTAVMMHEIGNSYFMLKSFDLALDYYQKGYRLKLQHLGKKHIDVADSQYCIGVTYSQLQNDEKALKYLELSLVNRKSLLGMKNKKVADTLFNIARVHKNCFEYALSISRLIKAHKIRQIIHGKNHVEVADTKYFIAIVLLDMGKYTDSLLFFNDAMDVYKKIGYKPTHHVNSNINRWVSFLENKLREKELCKCSKADSKNKSTEVDVNGNAKNDMKRNSSKVDSMDNNSKTDTQGSEVNFKEGNNSFVGYNISQVDSNGNLSKDSSKPDVKGNLPNLVPKSNLPFALAC